MLNTAGQLLVACSYPSGILNHNSFILCNCWF